MLLSSGLWMCVRRTWSGNTLGPAVAAAAPGPLLLRYECGNRRQDLCQGPFVHITSVHALGLGSSASKTSCLTQRCRRAR